jgi:hypothetical protein
VIPNVRFAVSMLERGVAMSQPVVFSDIFDAAEQLDADALIELVAVLSRRLAERGRSVLRRRRRRRGASSPPVSAKQ